MIKLIFRLLIVSVVGIVVYLILKYQPEINFPINEDRSATIATEINGMSVWHDRLGTYALIIFDQSPELFTLPNRDKSLSRVLQDEDAKLITNAGYYFIENGKLYYSGLLLVNGQQLSPINTRSTSQISHVMYWKDSKLGVLPADSASSQVTTWQNAGYSALQSGPLLINANQVQTVTIQNADNSDGRYLRTVIGQLLSGEKFIWIQKVPQTLMQLTESIQNHEDLKGKIDFALNLDGGSSTSLIVKNYSPTDFFTTKTLPGLLLIK